MTDTTTAGADKAAALQGVVSGMAQDDPLAAANFVADQQPGDGQTKAAVSVAGRWADSDPAAAAAWAGTFTGDARRQALGSVVQRWGQMDPAGAGDWLAALPKDADRDTIVQCYIDSTTWQYPEYAAGFAETIADENQRARTIRNVASNWINSDPEAAIKWVSSTDLPEDQKKRLVEQAAKAKEGSGGGFRHSSVF